MVFEMDESIFDKGQIILYDPGGGIEEVAVHLSDETVWLSLSQMTEVFERDKSVISHHLKNIFSSGELDRAAVVAKNATTATDGKTYQVDYYNLDAILSVGYRVNSKKGTQFRIWTTKVLKEHLVQGFTTNQHRLAEKGLAETQQVLSLLTSTLQEHQLASDEGQAVLQIVTGYASTWRLLLQYDENPLPSPARKFVESTPFAVVAARQAIGLLKKELLEN